MSQQQKSPLTESAAQEMTKSAFFGPIDKYKVPGANPKRSYKYISFKNFKDSGFTDHRGWIPLTKTTLTTEKVADSEELYGIKCDGFFHNGSAILAWMPKEMYDRGRKEVDRLTETKLSSVSSRMKRIGGEDMRAKFHSEMILTQQGKTKIV